MPARSGAALLFGGTTSVVENLSWTDLRSGVGAILLPLHEFHVLQNDPMLAGNMDVNCVHTVPFSGEEDACPHRHGLPNLAIRGLCIPITHQNGLAVRGQRVRKVETDRAHQAFRFAEVYSAPEDWLLRRGALGSDALLD